MNNLNLGNYRPSMFPLPRHDEAKAIEPLRQVRSLANTIANLLQDAQIARDAGEHDYADRYEQLAREAADSMLSVAEDAVRLIPNNQRDNQIKEQA